MAVAAIAALSSCSDNDVIDNAVLGNKPVKQTLVFTATMEGAPESRATYNSEYKCAAWEVNDQISINGYVFLAQTAGTRTDFSGSFEREIRPTYMGTSSSGFNAQGPGWLVDNGSTPQSTKWCASKEHMNSDGTWDIVVKVDMPSRLFAINLWNGNDTSSYPDRRWKKVKVSGSTSATGEWIEIKTFDDANLAINDYGLAGTLVVDANTEYEYYKIEVLSVVSGDVMQMSDMLFNLGAQISDSYKAFFPSYLYGYSTAALPSEITEEWTDGKFNMPMYAYSTDTNLEFKNLCGVLKITVKSDQMATVKSISISSANKAVSGAFTVDANNAAVLTNPDAIANTLTINYSNPIATDAAGKVFYVPVPAQTYRNLVIKVSDGSKSKSITTRSGVDVNIERKKIYPISFVVDNFHSTEYENYNETDGTVTEGWFK